MVLKALQDLLGLVPPRVVLVLVALGSIIEATPVLGILIPVHTAIFLFSAHWAVLHRSPVPLVLASTIGGTLGDILFYAAGRHYGLGVLGRLPGFLRLNPKRRAQIDALFKDHGMKTIVLSRSQLMTRSFGPFIAGGARMPFGPFALAAAVGSLVLSVAAVAAGYLFGLGSERLGHAIGPGLFFLVLFILAIFALYFWLTKRLAVMASTTLTLLLLGAVAGIGAGALIWDAADEGALLGRESGAWHTALASMPAWAQAVASPLAWLGDIDFLASAFIALFIYQAMKGRWRKAYLTFAAGPGLIAAIIVLRWLVPRPNPLGLAPRFPMTGSFPSDPAALAVSLAALVAWFVIGRNVATRSQRIWRAVGFGAAGLVGIAPLVIGRAWPSDTLTGFTLGTAWICALLLVDNVARRLLVPSPIAERGDAVLERVRATWNKTVSWCNMHLTTSRVFGTLIAAGIVIRLVAPWQWALGPDADRYAAMARGLQQTGSFILPWGDIYSPGSGPQYSHHYPPLYPLVLAAFYQVLGFSRDTTRIASIVTSLVALAVTYACTRNLYGHRKGLLATAVVALSPVLILTTNKAYSENLLLALFVVAMWAILKSLERPWYIVIGAIFAALGYLSKSSMGYFFIIAGLGGLAWRLRWRGWKVLRDPAYMLGIAIFGSTVAAWAYRNYRLFGSWQSSSHLAAAYDNAIAHPIQWALLLVFSFLFIFGLGYLLFLAMAPWLPALARIPRMHNEHDSGLWLAIMLPLPLTVAIDSALWLYEREFFLHNVRYVTFVVVPLVWLLMRNVKLDKAAWAAILATFAILIAGSLYYAVPVQKLENRVSSQFGPLVHDGDSITFVDTNDVYRYYLDITHEGKLGNFTVRYVEGEAASRIATTWAVVHGNGRNLPGGYTQVFEQHTGSGELLSQYTVWRHASPA